MQEMVGLLRDRFVGIWDAATTGDPGDSVAAFGGTTYTRAAHRRNERALRAFVDLLSRESRRARRGRIDREDSERRLLTAFGRFATETLGWGRAHLERLMAAGFRDAMEAFPISSRRFDPALTLPEIYQAARNALAMHCLQSLLGVPVKSTPSVLGYSLLYPYTDNLLDDERLDAAAKMAFSRRLARRLAGDELRATTPHEQKVYDLVAMIEGQFPRARYPDVFDSLLAIHRAQERSLVLLRATGRLDARTLVEICAEKGGTSVLADLCLISGSVTPQQAECAFGLGMFLQLRDDLEDVLDDRASGLSTVFSVRRDDTLDEPTARALAIGSAVQQRLGYFDAPAGEPVRELMASSLHLALTDAAASVPSLYSPGFLRELEAHSPFRLASLVEQRQRLSRAHGSLTGLLETWLTEATDGRLTALGSRLPALSGSRQEPLPAPAH